MRYVRELNLNMSFLLVSAVTALSGCSSDAPQALQPAGPIATVSVALDSTSLLIGHLAHATASAVDTSGHSVNVDGILWNSLDTTIATVSSTGDVKAVRPGAAQIQGTMAGTIGAASVTVLVAGHNFDDGTLGPYTYPYTQSPNDLDFPDDPTASGRGRVARLHYARTSGSADVNRSFDFTYKRGLGQDMFFRGEFYCAVSDITANTIQRKLLYFRPHTDYTKYGFSSKGNIQFYSFIKADGAMLSVDLVRTLVSGATDRIDLEPIATLVGNRWYRLEVQQRLESSVTASDGIFRVWLDGVLVYDKTDFKWIDPAWSGTPLPGGNGTPWDMSDAYFEGWSVGDQVNYSGTYDEYRYWNNVAFADHRIDK